MRNPSVLARECIRKSKETRLRIMLSATRVWEGRAIAQNTREELSRVDPLPVGWGSGLDYHSLSLLKAQRENERLAA